ncbi:hypothetical protein Tco_0088297 [Tanacetum coccineum]
MDEETSLQMDEEELKKLNEVIVEEVMEEVMEEVTVMEEVMEEVTVRNQLQGSESENSFFKSFKALEQRSVYFMISYAISHGKQRYRQEKLELSTQLMSSAKV